MAMLSPSCLPPAGKFQRVSAHPVWENPVEMSSEACAAMSFDIEVVSVSSGPDRERCQETGWAAGCFETLRLSCPFNIIVDIQFNLEVVYADLDCPTSTSNRVNSTEREIWHVSTRQMLMDVQSSN
jgi:hypothetical protein